MLSSGNRVGEDCRVLCPIAHVGQGGNSGDVHLICTLFWTNIAQQKAVIRDAISHYNILASTTSLKNNQVW